MDSRLEQILVFGSTDSVFMLGETFARRGGQLRKVWLVCVIHRGHGEFTHLYRVPAIPTGGRREVELLGVWAGARLREASDNASAMLADLSPVRATVQDRPTFADAA